MFEDLTLERLRERRSEKWSTYPSDVIPAFVAEMDFALAPPVRAALQAAIDAGDCGYAAVDGLAAAFSTFSRTAFGWSPADDRVFALPDVMAGVAESLRVFTQPGDGVVINPPVYPPFFEVIAAMDRPIVEVPLQCDPAQAWDIDMPALERAFAAGARAYLLCSPHNPVGRVWSKSTLRDIAELAEKYDVVVISDEIHAPLRMPHVDYTPFLKVAGPRLRAVALCSASKAWNIAGLKCGLIVAGSPGVRDALDRRFRAVPTETRWRVGHLGAIASTAAYRDGGPWLDALRGHLDANRRLLATLLHERIPRAAYRMPEATFLAWVNCDPLGVGDDPAAYFLERARVALEPGHRFGKQGAPYVRINMGTSAAILTQIVDRMARAL